MKKGREYEELIAKIYTELSPDAVIKSPDMIKGQDTGILREIDVAIRSTIGGHEILIAIQAKDFKKKPADVNVIGEFKSVLTDIRASKGILICASGFSKAAVTYAKNLGIDLCTAHDAETRDWKLDLKIPFLVVQLEEKFEMSVGITANPELVALNKRDIQVPMDIRATLSLDKGLNTFTVFELIKKLKQNGEFPTKSGKHKINFLKPGLEMLVETVYAPLHKIDLTYTLSKKGFLKYIDAISYRGIQNISSGDFNYTHLTISGIIPIAGFDDSWTEVDSEGIAITPLTFSVEMSTPFEMENMTHVSSAIHKEN